MLCAWGRTCRKKTNTVRTSKLATSAAGRREWGSSGAGMPAPAAGGGAERAGQQACSTYYKSGGMPECAARRQRPNPVGKKTSAYTHSALL